MPPDIGTKALASTVLALTIVLQLAGAANAQAERAETGDAALARAEASKLYGDPAHPNISGMWVGGATNFSWVDYSKTELPLKPKYAQVFQQTREMAARGAPIADPVARCQAFGMPRFITMDFTLIQTPGRITMYTEALHEIREVYMDGRPVPENWEPTWGGRSNGRWEGDTLVIETVGMKAGMADQTGLPYSEQLKVVERIHREGDVLINETTLIDPEVYTRPFSTVHTYPLAPAGYEFAEFICNENQRNSPNDRNETTAHIR